MILYLMDQFAACARMSLPQRHLIAREQITGPHDARHQVAVVPCLRSLVSFGGGAMKQVGQASFSALTYFSIE
jgi:hypothetical protein